MKTEAELRKYRDALRRLKNCPCDCAATGHAFQCLVGGACMNANEMVLSWILDELPDHDRMVETLLKEST